MRRGSAFAVALALAWGCGALTVGGNAFAVQIPFGPGDSFTKLEAAKAGDEVVIAHGTYAFRVHLTQLGTAQKPIVIRAADPKNKPVWDLSATLVENAPGSSTAGDRGRGCWQVDGGTGYVIESIVLTGCRNADKTSAGLRYYNGADVILRDAYVHDNDNGITGGTQSSNALVEWSEIAHNGDTTATLPTHNIYVFGGVFGLRYSYVHDSLQGQNFHIRAQNGLIESNWFARAKSYEGDLMTSDEAAPGTSLQSLVIRGNVFLQAAQPDNTSQVFAVFNDTSVAGVAFSVRVLHNTFIGSGKNSAFLHLSNADHTQMQAEVSNNILTGTNRAALVADNQAGILVGAANWLATGADPGPLVDTVFGATPGFKNAVANDFTLLATSAAVGKASGIPKALPSTEYYKDEVTARRYRVRASVRDLGAFESTTTDPSYGPYDPPPVPDAGPPLPNTDSGIPIPDPGGTSGGVHGDDAGPVHDAGGSSATPGASSSGCGCTTTRGDGSAAFGTALLVLGTAFVRRRLGTPRRR